MNWLYLLPLLSLLMGVVIGTYSSIFIATPAMLEFIKEEPIKEKKKKK